MVCRVILILLCLSACGCREQIIHSLTELEANRIVAALSEDSIVADKERQADGKWAVAVSKADAHIAIKVLDDRRLLRETAIVGQEKSALLSSREDQRFRFERAISREIEGTLLNMPGVLEARVHLNLPEKDPFFGRPVNDAPGTGSVLLIVKDPSILAQTEIATLVSGASGVPHANLSIVVSKAEAYKGNRQERMATELTNNEGFVWLRNHGGWALYGAMVALLGGLALFVGVFRSRNKAAMVLSAPAKSS